MASKFRSYSVNAGDKNFKSLLAISLLYISGIVVGSLSKVTDDGALSRLLGSYAPQKSATRLLDCIMASLKCNLPITVICFFGAVTVFGLLIPAVCAVLKGVICGYTTASLYSAGEYGYYFTAALLPQAISSLLLIFFSVMVIRYSISLSRLAVGNRSEYNVKSVFRLLIIFVLLSVACSAVDGLLTWLFYLIF